MKRNRKAEFSLIELLVTIAVIAILAGLLMPALNAARMKACAIACMNNQKQLHLMVINYTGDNDDVFMNENKYFKNLMPYYNTGISATYDYSMIDMKRRRALGPFDCPAENYRIKGYWDQTVDEETMYGGGKLTRWQGICLTSLSKAWTGQPVPSPVVRKISRVVRPSSRAMFFDMQKAQGQEPYGSLKRSTILDEGTVPRHNGYISVVYSAGNAAALDWRLVPATAYDPSTNFWQNGAIDDRR